MNPSVNLKTTTCVVVILTCVRAWGVSPISDTVMVDSIEHSLPSHWSLLWDTPDHLVNGGFLYSTDQASIIKYSDDEGKCRATVLLVKSAHSDDNPLGVYPHDYRRCSSINGRALHDINITQVRNGWFYRLCTIKHALVEHEMSFVVIDDGDKYRVDSKLFATSYSPVSMGSVYNFQVWSDSPDLTESIAGTIFDYLSGQETLTYSNDSAGAIPCAYMNMVNYRNNSLHLAITSSVAISAKFTVVAWTYPTPSPVVTSYSQSLSTGQQIIDLPLSQNVSLATEFEVFLAVDGQVVDSVLAASNHFGYFTSNWIPFAGPSSTVSIGGVGDPVPTVSSGSTIFVLNNSVVHLSGSLAANSWNGIFLDLIPESDDLNLSFESFDQVQFHAKQMAVNSINSFDIKLETNTGKTYRQSFHVTSEWTLIKIAIADFTNSAGQPWPGSDVIGRIVIAAVAGSSPTEVSLGLADLQVTRKPRLTLTIIGEGGRILIDPLGISCDSFCSIPISRNRTVSLVPQAENGYRFFGWQDNSMQHGNFQLDTDRCYTAIFGPLYQAPIVSIEKREDVSNRNAAITRLILADNSLFHLDWDSFHFRVDGLDLTDLLLNDLNVAAYMNAEHTQIEVDIPVILPGRTLQLDIRRKSEYGGQSASDSIEQSCHAESRNGDFSNDGFVTMTDLRLLAIAWMRCYDFRDFTVLCQNWLAKVDTDFDTAVYKDRIGKIIADLINTP